MTLILASIRRDLILLTSDGRSQRWTQEGITATDNHRQKLFPMPEHPLVFAQYGENEFDGQPVGLLLDRFMRQLNAGNFTIEQIADQLRAFMHEPVRRRLRAQVHPKNVCGFWTAGFTLRDPAPKLVENVWRFSDDVLSTEERQWGPISMLAAGDGQKLIPKLDWHRIADASEEQIAAQQRDLEKTAIDAKVDDNSVGGDVHEVLITRDAWKWTLPPPMTQPATGATTEPAASSSPAPQP